MYWIAQTFLVFLFSFAFLFTFASNEVVLAAAEQTQILVTGQVTAAPDGSPLANVRVMLYDSTFPVDYQLGAITDASGRYTVTETIFNTWWIKFEPPTEDYRIEYYNDIYQRESAQVFTTSPGMVLSGINAALSPPGQSQLTGQVTAEQDGAPLQSVVVSIYDASGKWLQEPVFTDSNGYYTFTEVALGTVKLHYDGIHAGPSYLAEYYNNKATLAEADAIVVASEQVQGIDVALDKGGIIQGTVRSSWHDRTLDRVAITLYDANGEIVRQGHNEFQSGYTIANLPPGAYRLRFVDPDNNHYAEYYDGRQSLEQAQPVTVVAGQTTSGIDAQLTLSDTHTVVSVATAEGAPGAIIVAYSHDHAPSFTLDNGEHWQSVPSTPWTATTSDPYAPHRYSDAEVGLVARAGSEGGVRLLYSDSEDLYRSDDLGQSWTKYDIGGCIEPSTVEAFVADRLNPAHIYLYQTCTMHDPFLVMHFNWLWYSADGGDTWQDQYDASWPQGTAAQIVPSPVAEGRLYVSSADMWLYRDKSGDPWVDKDFPVLTVVPDADDPNILYGWGEVVAPRYVGKRSFNGGAQWEDWPQQPCPTPHRIYAHPTESKVLFVRCAEGLFGSENGGDAWKQLTTTPGQRLALDYGTPGRILWVMDNGWLAASTDNGQSWQILADLLPLYLPNITTDRPQQ